MGLKKSESKQALAANGGARDVQGFNVPDGLRVGTLDSLMALSDDLAKMDTVSEATAFKIYEAARAQGGADDPLDRRRELRDGRPLGVGRDEVPDQHAAPRAARPSPGGSAASTTS